MFWFLPWFTGDQLVGCIGLADEYILGRLKHECIEYMISKAERVQLNECMLYLSLARKYQLHKVADKIIELNYQRSITDVMKCRNYDIVSAAPLMLRHAQWLEEEVRRNKTRIQNISAQALDLYTQVDTAVQSRFIALDEAQYRHKSRWASCSGQSCDGHRSNQGTYIFGENCSQCGQECRQQFKEKLAYMWNQSPVMSPDTTGLSWSSFSINVYKKFRQLNSLWYQKRKNIKLCWKVQHIVMLYN